MNENYTDTELTKESKNIKETTVLFIMAAIGCLGNLGVVFVILIFQKFRRSTTAFLGHHCFLDSIKSLYCFIYGYYFMKEEVIRSCDIIGSSYVFFVTMSAYNLLALVVNEEYEIHSPLGHSYRNHGCVLFGIVIVWFMCLLMNMGVAFLPTNPAFIPDIGNCIFMYGDPSNFVLHVLWMVLVSIAVFLSLAHFISMYLRVRTRSRHLKWSQIHQALSAQKPSPSSSNEEINLCLANGQTTKALSQIHLRRVMILLLMVTSFIVFWYPLFLLTLTDFKFQQPVQAYKLLTILTWCHPATTPIFAFFFLYDMSRKHNWLHQVLARHQPLVLMGQKCQLHHPTTWETADCGMYNTNFERHMSGKDGEDVISQIPILSMTDETENSEATLQIEMWDKSPTSPGKRVASSQD